MIQPGDIALADLRDETRLRVLVVSDARFHRLAARAVVVPEIGAETDEVRPPWRIEIEASVFAVDLLRSIPTDRLLDVVGRAPAPQFDQVRRAVRHIIT